MRSAGKQAAPRATLSPLAVAISMLAIVSAYADGSPARPGDKLSENIWNGQYGATAAMGVMPGGKELWAQLPDRAIKAAGVDPTDKQALAALVQEFVERWGTRICSGGEVLDGKNGYHRDELFVYQKPHPRLTVMFSIERDITLLAQNKNPRTGRPMRESIYGPVGEEQIIIMDYQPRESAEQVKCSAPGDVGSLQTAPQGPLQNLFFLADVTMSARQFALRRAGKTALARNLGTLDVRPAFAGAEGDAL